MAMMRKIGWSGSGRVAPLLGGVVLALIGLGACNGDTLYDAAMNQGNGPAVAFSRPTDGADVRVGRPVPIRIEASDSLGVSQIDLTWTGVASGVIHFEFVPPRTNVVVDTVIDLGTGTTGKLRLEAASKNGLGAVGRSGAVTVNVTRTDTVIPAVAVTVNAPPRVELTDSIHVRVAAADNDGGSGITTLGFTALVVSSTGSDTLVFDGSAQLAAPAGSAVARDFVFAPDFVDARTLPVDLSIEIHAWAVDDEGNCAAAVAEIAQRLACTEFRGYRIAVGSPPTENTTVVAGRSHTLATGSVIVDAVADYTRNRLFLSDPQGNRIDVLDVSTHSFGAPVVVGSQPWGLALNRTADTLLVANSGGTSVSVVPLTGLPVEAVSRRVHTPNTVLFTVERQVDVNGFERLQVRFYDFSDRPLFLAQDAAGRLLYSTLPTSAAPRGSIRVAENQAGWVEPEVRFVIGRGVYEADSTNISFLNVDSLRVFSSPSASDVIEIYDHRNGFPSQVISSGKLPLFQAIAALAANPESDMVWTPGHYLLDLVGLSTPTYVAASGDHQKVIVAEGGNSAGRVFMWRSATASISSEITVADLLGNTSEHIRGIDLNSDGTFGSARGSAAAFFFKDDLRLQGHFGTTGGGSGAVLHPQHPSYATYPLPGPATLAFVADGNSIRIVDTVHFSDRGRIEVRDDVVGPLRVSPPLSGDNASCSGTDCIVAKLYGVTNAGTVVVVDVHGRDIK